MAHTLKRSTDLFQRAQRFIPGGIWGHNKFPAVFQDGCYPYFADRGEGPCFFDVDGNRYIDYMCGYGAMINGYANREIDTAALERIRMGDCLNQPTEITVRLAERLCSLIYEMKWCAFAKNGSDATSMALIVARAATGRHNIVCVKGAYHGSHTWCNWCNPGAGRTSRDSECVRHFPWNDVDALNRIFQREGDTIAAVMLTPFHHPIPGPAEMPTEGFLDQVEKIVHNWGAVLILDEVRTGFRVSLSGAHYHLGFMPDLICYSKAIANTHPLAVLLGRESVRKAADSVFIAGTFWNCSAPMAAALRNLDMLIKNDALTTMQRNGERLTHGLMQTAARYGIAVDFTGPHTMPTMTFRDDADFVLMNRFSELVVRQGSFIHPTHNWFVSAAHTFKEIDETLYHADIALNQMCRAFI